MADTIIRYRMKQQGKKGISGGIGHKGQYGRKILNNFIYFDAEGNLRNTYLHATKGYRDRRVVVQCPRV